MKVETVASRLRVESSVALPFDNDLVSELRECGTRCGCHSRCSDAVRAGMVLRSARLRLQCTPATRSSAPLCRTPDNQGFCDQVMKRLPAPREGRQAVTESKGQRHEDKLSHETSRCPRKRYPPAVNVGHHDVHGPQPRVAWCGELICKSKYNHGEYRGYVAGRHSPAGPNREATLHPR